MDDFTHQSSANPFGTGDKYESFSDGPLFPSEKNIYTEKMDGRHFTIDMQSENAFIYHFHFKCITQFIPISSLNCKRILFWSFRNFLSLSTDVNE